MGSEFTVIQNFGPDRRPIYRGRKFAVELHVSVVSVGCIEEFLDIANLVVGGGHLHVCEIAGSHICNFGRVIGGNANLCRKSRSNHLKILIDCQIGKKRALQHRVVAPRGQIGKRILAEPTADPTASFGLWCQWIEGCCGGVVHTRQIGSGTGMLILHQSSH